MDQLAVFDAYMAPIKAREAQEREARDTAMRQQRIVDGLTDLGKGAPRAAMDAAYKLLPRHLADQVARQLGARPGATRDSVPGCGHGGGCGCSGHVPGSLAPMGLRGR